MQDSPDSTNSRAQVNSHPSSPRYPYASPGVPDIDAELLHQVKSLLRDLDASDYICAMGDLMAFGLHRVGDLDAVERVTWPLTRLMAFVARVKDLTSREIE